MQSIVNRLVDAWNSHDFSQVAALYSADCEGIDVGQSGMLRGVDGLHQIFSSYWNELRDLYFEVESSIEGPDAMALFWRATGTHRGSILRIPATGRAVHILGSAHHILSEGTIVRSLYMWDTAGLLRNLGLLPELSA